MSIYFRLVLYCIVLCCTVVLTCFIYYFNRTDGNNELNSKEKGFTINNSIESIPKSIYHVPKTLLVSYKHKDTKLKSKDCRDDVKEAVQSSLYDPLKALDELRKKEQKRTLKMEKLSQQQIAEAQPPQQESLEVNVTDHDHSYERNSKTTDSLPLQTLEINESQPSEQTANKTTDNQLIVRTTTTDTIAKTASSSSFLNKLNKNNQNQDFLPKKRQESKFIQDFKNSLKKVSEEEMRKIEQELIRPDEILNNIMKKAEHGDERALYHYYIEKNNNSNGDSSNNGGHKKLQK